MTRTLLIASVLATGCGVHSLCHGSETPERPILVDASEFDPATYVEAAAGWTQDDAGNWRPMSVEGSGDTPPFSSSPPGLRSSGSSSPSKP